MQKGLCLISSAFTSGRTLSLIVCSHARMHRDAYIAVVAKGRLSTQCAAANGRSTTRLRWSKVLLALNWSLAGLHVRFKRSCSSSDVTPAMVIECAMSSTSVA